VKVLDSTGAEAFNPGCPPGEPGMLVLLLYSVVWRLRPLRLSKGTSTSSGTGSFLTLALFVARVALADDHDIAVTTNDAALFTDRLDAGVDLHFFLLSLSSI
jgi:hypothetical protein